MCIRDRRLPGRQQGRVLAGAVLELEHHHRGLVGEEALRTGCLLYTSDAADVRSSVDLGGRRIIKKKKRIRAYRTSGTRETRKHHT